MILFDFLKSFSYQTTEAKSPRGHDQPSLEQYLHFSPFFLHFSICICNSFIVLNSLFFTAVLTPHCAASYSLAYGTQFEQLPIRQVSTTNMWDYQTFKYLEYFENVCNVQLVDY